MSLCLGEVGASSLSLPLGDVGLLLSSPSLWAFSLSDSLSLFFLGFFFFFPFFLVAGFFSSPLRGLASGFASFGSLLPPSFVSFPSFPSLPSPSFFPFASGLKIDFWGERSYYIREGKGGVLKFILTPHMAQPRRNESKIALLFIAGTLVCLIEILIIRNRLQSEKISNAAYMDKSFK